MASENQIVAVVNLKDEQRRIPCKECSTQTNHRILAQVKATDSSDDGYFQAWDTFSIVQCAGCSEIGFEHTSTNSEEYDYDANDEQYLLETRRHYPSRLVGRSELRDAHHLPHIIYKVYRETHAALSNHLFVLTGVGIRAIIEAVCLDRQLKGNLAIKIDALAAGGYVSQKSAEILHNLRFMGNDAVHEAKAHTEAELSVALDVAENLLSNVYLIPKRASAALSHHSKGRPPKD